jgi:hypothetical protein
VSAAFGSRPCQELPNGRSFRAPATIVPTGDAFAYNPVQDGVFSS